MLPRQGPNTPKMPLGSCTVPGAAPARPAPWVGALGGRGGASEPVLSHTHTHTHTTHTHTRILGLRACARAHMHPGAKCLMPVGCLPGPQPALPQDSHQV